MNISAIVFPQIATVAASAVAGVNAISLLTNSPLANVNESASIVDLSKFGQLLSAINNLQTVATQPATASTATGTGASFGTFIVATELFVNAFNDIQTNYVDATQNSLGTSFNYAVQAALNTQSTSGSGKTLLASLAEIGINYQTATSIPGSAGQFTIDLTTLQTAYSSNPAATASSLKQALKALGQVAAQLVVQNANLFTIESNATLTGTVPNSLFDINALAAPIATLSPANAAAVNTALQHLLNDQALAEAVVETQTAAPTALAANAETTTPATNNQAQVTFAPPTAATVAPATGATAENTGAAGTVNPVETATNPEGATNAREMEANPNQPVANAATLEQPLAMATLGSGSAAAAIAPTQVNTQANQSGPNTSNAQPANVNPATGAEAEANATALQNAAAANAIAISGATLVATTPAAISVNNPVATAAATTNVNTSNNVATTTTAVQSTAQTVQPGQPVAVGSPVAAAQVAPAANTSAVAANTINIGTNASVASTVAPPLSFSDPAYAAAVAAYHVNDSVLGIQNNAAKKPLTEPINDVVEVIRVRPVTLNLHQGPNSGARKENTQSADQTAQIPDVGAPNQHAVDIEI